MISFSFFPNVPHKCIWVFKVLGGFMLLNLEGKCCQKMAIFQIGLACVSLVITR